MLDWQTFLKQEILDKYEFSKTERAIFIAKFPDENTVKNNNDLKHLASKNTVTRQMWNIYNNRFCPKENRLGFLNIRGGDAKDRECLAWLKEQYDDWCQERQKQIISDFSNNQIVVEEEQLLTNPFTPLQGKVDDSKRFFNREKEKRRIFEILNSGSSVALIGESQIGKSSLLWAIEQDAETQLKPPRDPIYLNLRTIINGDDFYDALCDRINITTVQGYRLTRALENHRILLLLDKVENMTRDGFNNNHREQLRGLAEEGCNPPLRLVVTARRTLDLLFSGIKHMTSPFHELFTEEKIGRWNEETMRSFIVSRLNSPLLKPEAKSVSFTEEEIMRVMAESGGHPQELMKLCNEIYANYLEE